MVDPMFKKRIYPSRKFSLFYNYQSSECISTILNKIRKFLKLSVVALLVAGGIYLLFKKIMNMALLTITVKFQFKFTF